MVFAESLLQVPRWYALHTKCRHESAVAMRLEGKGIETFLPVRTIQRRWSDRKKLVSFPLFPGYVFVHAALERKRAIVETPSVVRLVGMNGPTPLPDSDIDAVRRFLAAEIQFDPYPYLIPGMAVEVVRGPLKGVIGVLDSKKNMHRLIINVEMINNSVATEIDAADVSPV